MSMSSPATDGDRAPGRPRPPLPPPTPAYLPKAGSPLTVDVELYQSIQQAPRELVDEFTLPIRSGRAWTVPAKSIVRISTPEGPQVGMSTSHRVGYDRPLTARTTGDLNLWNAANPRERFWAARTKQLHSSHVTTNARLWSCLPFMRPMVTIIADTLAWYGVDDTGGRVHDLLGTRCDPYINVLLSGRDASYDYHCHSNLTRAILPFGLTEYDVHDVINLFQVTGLDAQGRYFMNPCPARRGDHIEFFAEQDLIMALSTCPGGDLSMWGFGSDSEKEMVQCCRPLQVEVFRLKDEDGVLEGKWAPPARPEYHGVHGVRVPQGEREGTE